MTSLNDAEVAIVRANPAIAVDNLLQQLGSAQAVDAWLGEAGFVYSEKNQAYLQAAHGLTVRADLLWPNGVPSVAPLYCPHGHQRSINCPHGCDPVHATHSWDAVAHPELVSGGGYYSAVIEPDPDSGCVLLGVGHNFTRFFSPWDLEDLIQDLQEAREAVFEGLPPRTDAPGRASPLGELMSRFKGRIVVSGRSYSAVKEYINSTRAASLGLSLSVASPLMSEAQLVRADHDRTLVLVVGPQDQEPAILRTGIIKRFAFVCWDRADPAEWGAPAQGTLESMRVNVGAASRQASPKE